MSDLGDAEVVYELSNLTDEECDAAGCAELATHYLYHRGEFSTFWCGMHKQ